MKIKTHLMSNDRTLTEFLDDEGIVPVARITFHAHTIHHENFIPLVLLISVLTEIRCFRRQT